MIPHERSLVQKYQGRPFALLGINTDASRDTVKAQSEAAGVNWRSWYDGPGGPICDLYGVQSFPTILVLDRQGVVRYKNVRGPALEKAIETLLKE